MKNIKLFIIFLITLSTTKLHGQSHEQIKKQAFAIELQWNFAAGSFFAILSSAAIKQSGKLGKNINS